MQLLRAARPAMGSLFEIYLGGDHRATLETLAQEALDRVDWLEQQLSPYLPNSDLSRINAQAFAEPVPVAPNLWDLLLRLRHLSQVTEGAFDPTAGQLVRVWGFWRRGQMQGELIPPPDPALLAHIVRQIGWRFVALDTEERTIRFLTPELALHPGAVGKGYIVQCAAEFLREQGVECALLHCGQSSIVALGSPPDAEGWPIGLPGLREEETIGTLALRDGSLSTSGSFGQYVAWDGQRIGHQFDPRTGQPVTADATLSVLAPDAVEGDALATAFLVQGAAWARAFCAARPELGVVWTMPSAEGQTTTLIFGNTDRIALLGG